MRSLVFHVGPMKTGSSAIQAYLTSPGQSEVLYPAVGLWSDGAHHNLFFSHARHLARPDASDVSFETHLAALEDAVARDVRDTVISSELIPTDPTFISAVSARLSRYFARVVVVIVCREHIARAASLYNESVKDPVPCEQRSPDAFLRSIAPDLPYARIIADLPVRRVSALNYHGGDLIARFMALIGHPVPALPPIRENISLSTSVVLALLAVNRRVGRGPERRPYLHRLRHLPDALAPSEILFSQEAVADVRAVCDTDTAYLRSAFAITLPQRPAANPGGPYEIPLEEFSQIRDALRASGPHAQAVLEEVGTLAAIGRD